jgi:hypothetical protein
LLWNNKRKRQGFDFSFYEDLKEMLDYKGKEMDPSEILENKIDEYFMGISR